MMWQVADPAPCLEAGQHPAYCEWQHSGISGRQTGVQPRTSSTQWLGPIFGNWSKKPPFGREPSRRGARLLRGLIESATELVFGRGLTLPRSNDDDDDDAQDSQRLKMANLIEGLQVIRYTPGQHYHAHADYHTGRRGTVRH